MPLEYELKTLNPGTTSSTTTKRVHWSRVLHIAEELLEDDIYGTPRLESVYNTLMDLDKVVGASGEMFYRGAFPGLAFILDKDATFDGPQAKSDMEDEIEKYVHQMQRTLKLKGMKLENLSPQVADPSNHFEMYISVVAATIPMPKRILLGSERGELSSGQDENAWQKQMNERRLNFNEPKVLREFISKLDFAGVIKVPDKGYMVVWPELSVPSEKEKVDNAKTTTETIVAYVNSLGADAILPPDIFLEKIIGFSKEEIENIKMIIEQTIKETDEEEIIDVEEAVLPVEKKPAKRKRKVAKK